MSDDPFDIDRKEDAGELAYEHKHGIKSKEALTNDEQGAGCIIECIWARKLRNERDDMMREKILKEQRNPFFLPGDKVRDTRDAYRKTWRIVKRIAYDDTEKMTLREVGNDSNERTVLANQLIPFLEMVAKARTEEPIEHPSFTRAKALPEPWRSHFPKDVDDARMWLPEYRRVALDRTVLLVAKTRVECAWACYVMGVPGKNHDEEQFDVSHYGSKLTEERARFFFPEFAEVPYAD